jgi:autotransporter-associated beta strand protein
MSDAAGQSGRLTKTGAATLTLTGANTYSGGTTVRSGTLLLGANGALPAAGAVTLDGGTLDTGPCTNQAASLLVAANSALIPGPGQLTFTSQSGAVWSGDLAITGTLGRNRLRFDPARLTGAQRARITCNGKPVYFTADGFLTDIAPGLTMMVK